jgi:esterase/lipase
MWLILIIVTITSLTAYCQSPTEIGIVRPADGSIQPAMFYAPESETAVPLVVALHTWSGDYKQDYHMEIAQWCMKKGWAYIHPNFRGPNKHPEATGSELVVEDIVGSVEYVKRKIRIDTSSIYLVGTSGGGYTALVMAGHRPEIWAAVSAWVPISDLKAWYYECKNLGNKYYQDIAASCGGAPGDSPEVDKEYRDRSPLTYLAKAKGLTVHINAGIYDGHKGSVPISHSLLAFNELADATDKISKDDIRYFVEQAEVPEHFKMTITDPSYGEKYALFRRTSGNATITIFNGGHEFISDAAISWIEAIHNTKKHNKSDAGNGT